MSVMQNFEQFEKTKLLFSEMYSYRLEIKDDVDDDTAHILSIIVKNLDDAKNAKSDFERNELLDTCLKNMDSISFCIPNKHKTKFHKLKKRVKKILD